MHVGALARWHKEGLFAYGGREGSGGRFADGSCAMVLAESGQIGNFKRTLGFAWGTGPLPHWGPPYPKENTLLGGATLWALRGHPPAQYQGIAQFMKFLAEPRQQAGWASRTGFVPVGRKALKLLNDSAFYDQQSEQRTALGQLLNTTPSASSQGIRLGNFPQIRDVIEGELVDIVEGRKSVEDGLGAAVLKGNALLRSFRAINGAAGQGEI